MRMKKRPGQNAEHKHLRVGNALRQALLGGEFKPGGVLPGERLLAERFAVSYMTARRAIAELVAEGLLERRGKCTLVTSDALHIAGSVRLHLLCSQINTFSEPLLKAADEIARKNEWITQLTIIHGNNDPFALRAIASGDPCLLLLPPNALLEGKIGEALRNSHGPAVIVGNSPKDDSVPWVKADDRAEMRVALDHLRELGHRSILFVHDDIKHQGLTDGLDEWMRYVREQNPRHPRSPLCVKTESYESRPRTASQAIKRCLKNYPRPSAIICDNDELALGVLHGLRELGVKVPGEVSVISFGNTVLAEYATPALSVMDVQFERHIQVATDLILEALRGRKLSVEGHIIRPRFIPRESTAPARVSARR
ncbi:MAG: GntR family transcriptional regulator [Verrucomicrobiales bacterium]|nr:GntR family transcriptional regulator [Verrucomicrobiales bacterium]